MRKKQGRYKPCGMVPGAGGAHSGLLVSAGRPGRRPCAVRRRRSDRQRRLGPAQRAGAAPRLLESEGEGARAGAGGLPRRSLSRAAGAESGHHAALREGPCRAVGGGAGQEAAAVAATACRRVPPARVMVAAAAAASSAAAAAPGRSAHELKMCRPERGRRSSRLLSTRLPPCPALRRPCSRRCWYLPEGAASGGSGADASHFQLMKRAASAKTHSKDRADRLRAFSLLAPTRAT